MIFQYDLYAQFLLKMKSLGEVKKFEDWKGEKCFLLRHDVDLSVELAYKLAQIEEKCDVRSTYFILPTCNTYNILNRKNRNLIKKLSDAGHEIGLHFDPSLYTNDENMNSAFKQETALLEMITGEKVKSVSLHNPSVHNQYPAFEGYLNAYDSRIFSNDKYLSDSRMNFRGKNPFEFISNVEKSVIQVLTHPMHFTKSGRGYDKILKDYIDEVIGDLDDYFRDEFKSSTYLEMVAEKPLSEILLTNTPT